MKRNSLLVFVGAVIAFATVAGFAKDAAPAAQFRVTGLGWQDNRLAHGTLTALLGGKPRATLDANNIEDAALILFSQQTEEGYLTAHITAELKLPDGSTASYPLDARLYQPLPRPLEATAVTLRVDRGPRFVLQEIAFTEDQFHNPELLQMMSVLAPETKLLELIDTKLFPKDAPMWNDWEGRSSELEAELCGPSSVSFIREQTAKAAEAPR